MTGLPDARDRERAVSEFSRNLVVVAGAGTGKTSLLIERILSAVALGVAGLDDIAAITFTEKAAGEMRERLGTGLERLRALARGELESEREGRHEAERAFLRLSRTCACTAPEIAERALQALEGLERARVATIHAFCAELLRENPVAARIAPDFQVDEGDRTDALFETEWAAFLKIELGDPAPRGDAWRALLRDVPLPVVRELARAVSGFAIPASALAEPDVALLFERPVARLLEATISMLERQEDLSPKPLAYLEAVRRVLETLQNGDMEGGRAQIERETALDRDKPPGPNSRLRNVDPAAYRDVTGEAHRLFQGIRRLDAERFERLVGAVLPFAERFRETLLRRGIITFDGLLSLARDLLRDHPGIRERLKRRYRMLLLDEFQDTDPLQYEIVLFLAEVRGGGGRDAYQVELEPGRLFVVGDPKQSIYRFRGADYSAFVRAVERIAPEPDRLHLVANFRGVPEVVEPVNRLLAGADSAWQPDDYQPEYESIRSARKSAGTEGSVELWTVEAGSGARERREVEGKTIAAEIHRLVSAEECGYGDVMILLRAFTHLPLYLRPLRQWGIPFVVDGGRELLERTEVVQLLAVLRAIARPSDPVALLGFLRSPVGGVADTELAGFAPAADRWDWRADVDPEEHPGVHRAFALLQRVAGRIEGKSADFALSLLVEETHLLPLAAFGYEGAQRVANLRKVLAAAVDLAREGRLTRNEILDAVEKERIADLEGESPLADETWGSVRVLTVHKAKGLQSEVVFVPDLAREPVSPGPRALVDARLVHPPGDAALAIQAGGHRNAAALWHQAEEVRHESSEEIRTLYVALTRARERLVLLAGRSRRRAAWVRALGAWGYDVEAPPEDGAVLAGGIRHRIAHAARPPSASGRPANAWDSGAVERWERAVARLGSATPPFARPSGSEAETLAAYEPPKGGGRGQGKTRALARAVGRTAHRLLEHWDLRDESSLLERLSEFARGVAEEEGLEPATLEAGTLEVLKVFLGSPLAERLQAVEILGREVPMLRADPSGMVWRGSIDLLYREGGQIVVADFKTDPDDREARSRHAPQLREYGEAVRQALDLPALPRTELWMLRTGRILQTEEDPGGTDPPRLF